MSAERLRRSRAVRWAAFFVVLLGLSAWFGVFLLAIDGFEFPGGGLRERLFIRGTLLGRLGLVTPDGPVRYQVRGRDGTAPESNTAVYVSTLPPDEVVAASRARCHALALSPTDSFVHETDAAAGERVLTCEGKEGEIHITARPHGSGSRVTVLTFEQSP